MSGFTLRCADYKDTALSIRPLVYNSAMQAKELLSFTGRERELLFVTAHIKLSLVLTVKVV